MFIHHVAIWSPDIEKLRLFYEKYFEAKSGKKYINESRQFSSYMLSFGSEKCRLEIMQVPGLHELPSGNKVKGYAHISISVGSADKVNDLASQLKTGGFEVINEPRTTGDGYYESLVLDPDGNQVEITV